MGDLDNSNASQNDEGAAAAAAAAAGNASGDQGNGAGAAAASKPTWIEQLPAAMREDESLHGYKTIGDLVTAYKATTQDKGDGGIKVPGENATAEEKAAFAKAIGIPETPDGYVITKPEDFPKEIPYDENLATVFKQKAHNLNLPASAAAELWRWYHSDLVTNGAKMQAEADKKAQETSVHKLKDDWGMKYNENTEIAIRAFKKFGAGSETILDQKLNGIRLGDSPEFMRIFHNIGKAISDDTTIPGGPSSGADNSEEKLHQEMFKNSPQMLAKK